MIILNYSHPLTAEQLAQIEQISGQMVENVFDLPVQFENDQPYLPQLEELMKSLPLSSAELQTGQILVNLPSLNYIAGLVLAELHGRMGYFPPIIRLRPKPDVLPPVFEVAEILNLNAVRETARKRRY
jgi:hypothetical protein